MNRGILDDKMYLDKLMNKDEQNPLDKQMSLDWIRLWKIVIHTQVVWLTIFVFNGNPVSHLILTENYIL